MANSNWQTVANPCSTTKPGCWMLKQGNFITGFFPKKVQANLDSDVGVFGFPPATAGGENPTLGGGDLATLLNDNASAKAVMKLMSDQVPGHRGRQERRLHLPAQGLRHQPLPEQHRQGRGQRGLQSTAFLFDGSDAMPAVGRCRVLLEGDGLLDRRGGVLDEAMKNID